MLPATCVTRVRDEWENGEDETVITGDVRRRDLRKLQDGEWLNGEIINAYMGLMRAQDRTSYYAKTFVVQQLLQLKSGDAAQRGKYSYANAKSLINRIDLAIYRRLYFPININNQHWTLVVVDLQSDDRVTLRYYDSMGSPGHGYLDTIERLLQDNWRDMRQTDELPRWLQQCPRILGSRDTPQQENGCDCGVFVTCTVDHLRQDLPVDFTQQMLIDSQYRYRMAYAIIANTLDIPDGSD